MRTRFLMWLGGLSFGISSSYWMFHAWRGFGHNYNLYEPRTEVVMGLVILAVGLISGLLIARVDPKRQVSRDKNSGFTLIEMLLVLACIGILSAVAIPTLLGQRQQAAINGDAKANVAALRMVLESNKSDGGTYLPSIKGAPNHYSWTSHVAASQGTTWYPAFQPGSSRMHYMLDLNNNGLGYQIVAFDSTRPGNPAVAFTDDTGTTLDPKTAPGWTP